MIAANSSDDGVAGSVSSRGSAGGVAGSSAGSNDDAGEGPRRRRGGGPRTSGVAVFLLILSGAALFTHWAPPGGAAKPDGPMGGHRLLLGAAFGRWELHEHSEDPEMEHMGSMALKRCKADNLYGFSTSQSTSWN